MSIVFSVVISGAKIANRTDIAIIFLKNNSGCADIANCYSVFNPYLVNFKKSDEIFGCYY